MSDFEGLQSQTGIEWRGSVGVVQFGGGSQGQLAIFYNKSVHNPLKSKERGHYVYEDKVYVRVAPPGERLNIVDRPATGEDARRWPVQWAAFQQNREQTPEGAPVDLLYPESPAVAATLRANGVHTIEQLANLSANAIENVGMGSQKWVNDAQKYLTIANKGVTAVQFRKEIEDKDREIKVMSQQIEQLKQQVAQLQSTSSTSTQLEAIQQLLAGAMTRPTMPNANVGQAFDVATAQINASHTTNQLKPKRQRLK